MEVVKIGGPVYRIGLGGGAASSVEVQGDNKAELDFRSGSFSLSFSLSLPLRINT